MTIQEMHIAVNLGVQKIASFQVDNLLQQEIDHELNNAMDRFIKQRYSPLGNKYRDGFEQSQKRIDDLRNLVVSAKVAAWHNGPSVSGFYSERAPLPLDYLFLVNVLAEIHYLCEGKLIEGEHYSIAYPLNRYVVASLHYKDGWNLTNVEINGIDVIEQNSNITAQQIKNAVAEANTIQKITVIDSKPVFGTSNANSLLAYQLTPTTDSNHIVFHYGTDNSNPSVAFTFTNPITEEIYEATYNFSSSVQSELWDPSDNLDVKQDFAMYVQHDDLYMLMSDPFNKPSYNRIKYTIEENFIDIHNDNSFITKFVKLKYIRQPKRMDKGLNVGCELPEHTHQEIVEMAIQSILEAISDPRYNSQSREVLESE
jgi:hypothetical protein